MLCMMLCEQERIVLSEPVAQVNIHFFLVHMISCSPAERAITASLYNDSAEYYSNSQPNYD